jgi:murein DD-endopeptidase MepM/ murein hydrolase activator NlpD
MAVTPAGGTPAWKAPDWWSAVETPVRAAAGAAGAALGGAGETVEQTIRRVAGAYSFSNPDLLVATARQESGLNPQAVGDQGQSYGVFQEHSAGRGHGVPVASRQDVAAATERAIREFNAIRARFPDADPGTWAAKAQRPLDPVGYARSVNALLGQRPATSAAAQTAPAAQAAQAAQPAWWSAIRPATAPATTPATTPATSSAPSPSGAAQTGTVWPVAGRAWGDVINAFGGRQVRNAGATVSLPSRNVGADLGGTFGETIVSPVSGRVVEVHQARSDDNPNEHYGWGGSAVVLGDDGYYYRMSHQRAGSIGVKPGQVVNAGDYIGQVGHSGNAGKGNDHLDLEKYTASGPMAGDRQYVNFAAARGSSVPAAPAGQTSAAPAWWAAV